MLPELVRRPIAATYLEKEHTRKCWRKQQSIIITVIRYNGSDPH